MAQKVKNFRPSRKPKATKYPWAKWLRVGTLRIKKGKGKDFTCQLDTMADLVRKTAHLKGKRVKVWIEAETQTIVFRVFKTR